MDQSVEALLSLPKVPGFSPSTQAVHTCDPCTPEVEAGRSEFQGHFWLHIDFEAILDGLRPKHKTKPTHALLSVLHPCLVCELSLCSVSPSPIFNSTSKPRLHIPSNSNSSF